MHITHPYSWCSCTNSTSCFFIFETRASLSVPQDAPGARGITDLYEALDLGNVGDGHRLSVIGTRVQKGKSVTNDGVQDARDLILEMMSDN